MVSLKGDFDLVLVLLFVSVLYFGIANAQAVYFITSEKIVSSGTQCSDTGFEEVGTFSKGDGEIIRHCVQRAGFAYSGVYVTNSYFEVYDGVDDCKSGGDTAGSFNDISGTIINLCIDRKNGDALTQDMLISNVSIINGSDTVSCLGEDYNTGISVQVSGGNVIHCASGGNAGGGLGSVTRNGCGGFSGFISEILSECNYNLNVPGTGGVIGEVLEGATVQEGPETCPNITCTCMEREFDSTVGWNCTVSDMSVGAGECSLTNARWTNLNLEDKSSANLGENLTLVADVSNECNVGRAVKCDIYKKTDDLESEQHRRTLNGNVNVTTNSNTKVAFCKWNASLFSDVENTSYYFKIWFSDNASSKIKSGEIEINNITVEAAEETLLVDDGNGNITWASSTRHSKSEDCPENQFIVRESRENWGSIYCAQFNSSNGEPIVWGEEREIGFLNTLRGFACERYEGMIRAPKQLTIITLGKMKCATMQDGEGKKVGRNAVELHRKKSLGCEHDGVVYAYNVFWNRCVNGLHLVSDSESANSGSSGEQNNNRQGLFGGNGLFAGLRNGPLGGILNGLLGNLGGLLGIFR